MAAVSTRFAIGALIAVVAGAIAGGSALTAGGTGRALACGDSVSGAVKLTADLSCTGDGLVVNAGNIKIDLNGHTLSGDGGAGDVGVDNTAGFDNVTIANGTIVHFDNAARLGIGAGGNTVTKLLVMRSTGDGVFVSDGADGNTVAGNTIVETAGRGIALVGSHETVKTNVVTNTSSHAIESDGSQNTISGNTILHAGNDGIYSAGNGAMITKNDVEGATGDGVALNSSGNATVSGNTVIGAHSQGISVVGNPDNVQILKNTTNGNDTNGIFFDNNTGVVVGNTANGNGIVGILACSDGILASKNSARWNGDVGIWLHSGADDGGGNSASANAGTPQIYIGSCN